MSQNNLAKSNSPYLLQHKNNPVHWFEWEPDAFEKAKKEDKPIFLSIGYSTCHWCHVMAHESFEDQGVADILNKHYVSIKVDKEQRPDIDSVYMEVCQALTGSGGWPTSIFMTPDQKPFFAGTYFPKEGKYGSIGFIDLLLRIKDMWIKDRQALIKSSDEITLLLSRTSKTEADVSMALIDRAYERFRQSFDPVYGGFGQAPKFPTPHNLMFLLYYYHFKGNHQALQMVEKTLTQMYRGGIFDHIGGGFSRYSTDRYYLAPHFEKMLYDNALLALCYTMAFNTTGNALYKNVAIRTLDYITNELTNEKGGFYCGQDADSDGIEGKFYVFTPEEIIQVLGEEEGQWFNRHYDITLEGNFEGKNIPNLLKTKDMPADFNYSKLSHYRKSRTALHVDDKSLTSWNALAIAAFAYAYRVMGDKQYLQAAEKAYRFIDTNLSSGAALYVSHRKGKTTGTGFLDDYGFYIFSLIHLYEATFNDVYLNKAILMMDKGIMEFYDAKNGGFYLYGQENEQLILRPKETYDGAMPSGNSMMAYNLIKLARLTKNDRLLSIAEAQLKFMAGHVDAHPSASSFYIMALSLYLFPHKDAVCVLTDIKDKEALIGNTAINTTIRVYNSPTKQYPLTNNQSTYYICENSTCFPPVNQWH